jgi:hypothetical protein
MIRFAVREFLNWLTFIAVTREWFYIEIQSAGYTD